MTEKTHTLENHPPHHNTHDDGDDHGIPYENFMIAHPDPPDPLGSDEELKMLRDALCRTLGSMGQPEHVLIRQSDILDKLFSSVLSRSLACHPETTPDEVAAGAQWMSLALRIQKQCMDTVKAKSSVEYMDMLNRYNDYTR